MTPKAINGGHNEMTLAEAKRRSTVGTRMTLTWAKYADQWREPARSMIPAGTYTRTVSGKQGNAIALASIDPNRPNPSWLHARQLPDSDLRRHASVSLDNRHRCEDCFCCAALTVLEQRHPQLTGPNAGRILDAMEGN